MNTWNKTILQKVLYMLEIRYSGSHIVSSTVINHMT